MEEDTYMDAGDTDGLFDGPNEVCKLYSMA